MGSRHAETIHPDNGDYNFFAEQEPLLFITGSGKEWYDVKREQDK